MATNLNTNTPDQLIYENDILELTVLGGIKLEGLDRMRVTPATARTFRVVCSLGKSLQLVRKIFYLQSPVLQHGQPPAPRV